MKYAAALILGAILGSYATSEAPVAFPFGSVSVGHGLLHLISSDDPYYDQLGRDRARSWGECYLLRGGWR